MSITMLSAMLYFFVFGVAAYNGTIHLEEKIAALKAQRDRGLIEREMNSLSLLSASLLVNGTLEMFESDKFNRPHPPFNQSPLDESRPDVSPPPPFEQPGGVVALGFFKSKNLNLLSIYDLSGKFIGGGSVDTNENEPLMLPEFDRHGLPPGHPLLTHTSLKGEIVGLFFAEKATLLVSSRPIPDLTKSGKMRGTLIIARLVDEKMKQRLRNEFDADINLIMPEQQAELPQLTGILHEIKTQNFATKLDKDKKRFIIYQNVPVLNSETDALLETYSPNIIHGLIDRNWYTMMALFALIGLSIMTLLFSLTQIFLVRPMQSLTKTMVNIHDTQTLPNIKALNRKDEIGIMAREFSGLLQRLQVQTKEVMLLGELDNLLAASENTEEASAVITKMASSLLAGHSGALSLLNASRNLYTTLSHWGDEWLGEQAFSPTDCWALRRGQEHVSDKSTPNPECQHLPEDLKAPVLCVPLMAQGETLGVMHIMAGASGKIEDNTRRLAASLAEHTSLALANLRLRDALRFQSVRDPLTGLFNRRYLEESLEREIARAERRETQVAVMMLDLDHFKRFNDAFGHEAGDYVLKQLGLSMKSFVRKEDIACRFGGEEFTFILPDTDRQTALRRAEEFCERIRTLDLRFHDKSLGVVTVSIGVAGYPQHGAIPEALLHTADTALYRAKKEGRDRAVAAGQASPRVTA